eukprot:2175680-Prymnesium_polylepis.1
MLSGVTLVIRHTRARESHGRHGPAALTPRRGGRNTFNRHLHCRHPALEGPAPAGSGAATA